MTLLLDRPDTDRLLSQLFRQGLAVHLARLCVLLSLCGLLDPADEARVAVFVLLQGRAQDLQVSTPGKTCTNPTVRRYSYTKTNSTDKVL